MSLMPSTVRISRFIGQTIPNQCAQYSVQSLDGPGCGRHSDTKYMKSKMLYKGLLQQPAGEFPSHPFRKYDSPIPLFISR